MFGTRADDVYSIVIYKCAVALPRNTLWYRFLRYADGYHEWKEKRHVNPPLVQAVIYFLHLSASSSPHNSLLPVVSIHYKITGKIHFGVISHLQTHDD